MSSLLGLSLTMLLAHGPTNGFNPAMVYVVRDAGELVVKGAAGGFDAWLAADPEPRAAAVKYFVACALDDKIKIRFTSSDGRLHMWQGAFGLGGGLLQTVGALGAGKTVSLAVDRDPGRWISSCMMAFANVDGHHQYIALLGNPPAWKQRSSAGERWTMGYPEGVFFGDLLNFHPVPQSARHPVLVEAAPFPKNYRSPTRSDLEKSYTLSLNLPQGYGDLGGEKWGPPNASNGRTLDFDRVTPGHLPDPVGEYKMAERIGFFASVGSLFFREGDGAVEPLYPYDAVAVRNRKVVEPGSKGARTLRPLFVHAPRVVSLAAAGPGDGTATMEAVDAGKLPLDRAPCTVDKHSCTGAFWLFTTGQQPQAPADRSARVLHPLKDGQSVVAVLRYFQADQTEELVGDDRDGPYTAIVRYRSAKPGTTRIEVSDPTEGGWRAAGEAWPQAETWIWLQVFPVRVVLDSKVPALKIRLTGIGHGSAGPVLDVAGFVKGKPWCHDRDEPFVGVCPDEGVPHVAAGYRLQRKRPAH